MSDAKASKVSKVPAQTAVKDVRPSGNGLPAGAFEPHAP